MLDKLLGGGRGGMLPITMALLGVLAYRTLKGKGRLADMLGRTPAGGGTPGAICTGAMLARRIRAAPVAGCSAGSVVCLAAGR